MLPAAENVALAGEPKIEGCGEGAALHDSASAHAGGDAGGSGRHGACEEHSCASYTSNDVSKSEDTSLEFVKKNTSPPVSLASMNPDSPDDVPEEIRSTQPPTRAPYVAKEPVQPPTPMGSYSYTSS
jgi:hypothetical protein